MRGNESPFVESMIEHFFDLVFGASMLSASQV